MTEEQCRNWLIEHLDVSRETLEKLSLFVQLLLTENKRQNLIAASTEPHIWFRHILDSAQILNSYQRAELNRSTSWWDIGSGAGLPGVVLALLGPMSVHLVEPRKKRIEFLHSAIEALNLDNVTIHGCAVAAVKPVVPATCISARAYAAMPKILDSCSHLANERTDWLLSKGRQWQNEMDMVSQTWHYMFHVKQSVTNAEGAILHLTKVIRKRR